MSLAALRLLAEMFVPMVARMKLNSPIWASPAPTPLAPGLRPAGETVPGFQAETWFGLYGHARLPTPLAAQHAAAAAEAIRDPALSERFAGLGADVRGENGAALAATAREEREKWTQLVRDLGIKPEG